jgi:hypothetical protein
MEESKELSNRQPHFSKSTLVAKLWGFEEHIVNNKLFCGKILKFNKGYQLSYHAHRLKTEIFYSLSDNLEFCWIDPDTTEKHSRWLKLGETVLINPGLMHSIIAHEYGEIIEISTQDFVSDSYRVEPSKKILEKPQWPEGKQIKDWRDYE